MSADAGAPLPPALQLRPASAADLAALAALYAHCALELGPQVYNAEQVIAWQRLPKTRRPLPTMC
ncbi:MAG: hypothetical protein ACRC2B_11765 [Rubrivivax sp.]